MVKRKSKYTTDWRELEIKCDGVMSAIILWLDGGTCAFCDGTYLMAGHHIVRRECKTTRNNPNNIILLCQECHAEAHADKDHFLGNLKHKFPKMYDWYEMNQHPEDMMYYRQYLEKIYPELKRIQAKMRGEHEDLKKRFGRI